MSGGDTPTCGFIGLGHQGTPIARRMIDQGLRPWLWARRDEVLDKYRDTEAQMASSPADLAGRCDVIGLCLYDAEATESVVFGEHGIMSAARPGTVVVNHATVGPGYAAELAERALEGGVEVVDAPVSGGDAALEGQLLVILGGTDDACERARSMVGTYAGTIVKVGTAGAAQAAKVVNNALMMAITDVVYDAFELGEKLGIDPTGLGEVLASGSAANPSVGIYLDLGPELFAIRGWPTLHKDLRLVEEVAARVDMESSGLVTAAEAVIRRMEHLRADHVEERETAEGR